jgi:hypothetical protein
MLKNAKVGNTVSIVSKGSCYGIPALLFVVTAKCLRLLPLIYADVKSKQVLEKS